MMTTRCWLQHAGLAALVALGGASAHAAEPRYGFRDLGDLGGSQSWAFGINKSGEVVGSSDTMGPRAERAFRWSGAGVRNLGALGGRSSNVYGINDAGEVVGAAEMADGGSHAFLWVQGSRRDLGTLGGRDSYAYGVNAA